MSLIGVQVMLHCPIIYISSKIIKGRNAEEREGIYDDFKRELRQFDHMGHGPIDIALWDLAGKKLDCSVNFY